MYTVTLRSQEYGEEDFSYPTKKAARAGFARLVVTARKEHLKDHIRRSVRFESQVVIIENGKR